MLSLQDLKEGAVAIRTDLNKDYILLAPPASNIANWTELLNPIGGSAGVRSVNGQVGTIVLTKADLNLGKVDNTSDLDKPVSTATSIQLALKEDLTNKVTDIDFYATSNEKYPTVKAIKDYVDTSLSRTTIDDASPSNKGKIRLAGDLSGTADSPKIANGVITTDKISGAIALANGGTGATTAAGALENLGSQSVSNLSNDLIGDANSSIKYPSVRIIKSYVDNSLSNVSINNDATSTSKGRIQLTGDLTGTADSPLIKDNAIISSKILDGTIAQNDLGNGAVSSIKILDGTIQATDLADNAVETPKIKNFSVTNFKIADGAISDTKIANGISKSKVGLDNVDNTSDLNKPVSTATQNALNLKLDVSKVGAINGAASLNSLGKVPSSQLPPLTFSSVDVVASQTAMLSLTGLKLEA
jgi:hypothetical protein